MLFKPQLARNVSELWRAVITVELMELFWVASEHLFHSLVYDVTCQSSFENLQTWLSECENYCTDQAEDIIKLLVANKVDLVPFLFVAWSLAKPSRFNAGRAELCEAARSNECREWCVGDVVHRNECKREHRREPSVWGISNKSSWKSGVNGESWF